MQRFNRLIQLQNIYCSKFFRRIELVLIMFCLFVTGTSAIAQPTVKPKDLHVVQVENSNSKDEGSQCNRMDPKKCSAHY